MSRSSYKPNVLFWIIGVLALAWNSMGIKAYLDQAYQTEAYFASTPKEMQEIAANAPSWVTAVFAVAVFVSTLACLLLLFRKKAARLLFLIGLLAVLIQTINTSFTEGIFDVMDSFNLVMFLMIPAISFFLYFYSKSAASKGWIY